MEPLVNMLTGAGIKLISGAFNSHNDRKARKDEYEHQQRIAEWEYRNKQTFRTHEAGFDATTSDITRYTRRYLAFAVTFTFCFLVAFCVAHGGNEIIQVPRDSGVFSFFFGTDNQATRETSLRLYTLNQLFAIAQFVFGFFMVPVAKQLTQQKKPNK